MTVTKQQTKSARSPRSTGVRSGVSKRQTAAGAKLSANAFPKSARLLKHPTFQRVYETGRKHFSSSMIFFYVLKPVGASENNSVEIGLTVGRALGGSVDRNRIKRRMRDCVRHELAALRDALTGRGISAEIVINPKKIALTADIAKLRQEIARGFAVIAVAKADSNADANNARSGGAASAR
jgi:ribonuclease P protein component